MEVADLTSPDGGALCGERRSPSLLFEGVDTIRSVVVAVCMLCVLHGELGDREIGSIWLELIMGWLRQLPEHNRFIPAEVRVQTCKLAHARCGTSESSPRWRDSRNVDCLRAPDLAMRVSAHFTGHFTDARRSSVDHHSRRPDFGFGWDYVHDLGAYAPADAGHGSKCSGGSEADLSVGGRMPERVARMMPISQESRCNVHPLATCCGSARPATCS